MEKKKARGESRPARYQTTNEVVPRVADEARTWVVAGATSISATEAARNFSDLINRVCYKGETFVVERGGKPMCSLTPVEARRCTGADLLALLATLAKPPEEFLTAVEEISRRQGVVEPSPWEK